MATEHVATHDGRTDILEPRFQHRRTFVDFAAFQAVRFPPGRERNHPFVESLATDAQRLFETLPRAGDEAVQRDRSNGAKLGHVRLLLKSCNGRL